MNVSSATNLQFIKITIQFVKTETVKATLKRKSKWPVKNCIIKDTTTKDARIVISDSRITIWTKNMMEIAKDAIKRFRSR